MSLDCGTWIAKYVLCLFNFIFFILGTVVLGIGIWLAADKSSFVALLKMVENEHLEQFTQPAVIDQLAYVLIVCGSITFLLSFLGYCGAIRESKCLLTTYASLMILILVAEICVGSIAAAYKDRTKAETKEFLQSTISRYYSTREHTDAVTLMWNHIMAQMSCCGVNDYKDFSSSENWMRDRGNRTVPEACCMLNDKSLLELRDTSCPYSPSESNSYYKRGCYEAVLEWIQTHQTLIIGVGIGIGLIQLLAIFLAFCLCKAIDKFRGMRL
uniref:Tetraspanin n=1 Tax=Nyssomyia neivai TaxID=330878 RepID=A0A1L8DK44_9DIPT